MAVAPAAVSPANTAQVEQAAMMAVQVDEGAAQPPVETPGGLALANYEGAAVQRSVTTTSSPWQLCPQGGVRLSAIGIHEMQTYTVAEINRYFTGVQEQTEMRHLAGRLTGMKNLNPKAVVLVLVPKDTIAQAAPVPCSQVATNNWSIWGPSVTSLVQWSSVIIGTGTASANGIFHLDEQACGVSPKADLTGGHAVSRCSAPAQGNVPVSVSLTKSADGTWKVDQLTYHIGG
ncbi:MAG: hypothetical protein ACYDEY_13895 [Acidimicrobiales bacterium]